MNVGMILIWVAFALGLMACVSAFIHYFTGREQLKVLSYRLGVGSGTGIAAAALLLAYYMLKVETAYSYVFQHSSTDLVWYYRLSALWAGQEGSFLLWTGFIFLMLAFMHYSGDGKALKDTKLLSLTRAISLFVASFFLFLLVLKNPFSMYYLASGTPMLTNWNPFVEPFIASYAQGMNPLLRNPWMAIHPPLLFLGYAAFTVPFAAAMASLLLDEEDWVRLSTAWMRVSWLFLTLGIGFGALWAYEVLGWGAWYWTWDPVETSSLIPWITATAYLHARLRAKSGDFRLLLPLLAIVSFLLVIFSTFVTRSGLWASVHSWQDFTTEGMLIALFLSLLLGSSAFLVIKKYFRGD